MRFSSRTSILLSLCLLLACSSEPVGTNGAGGATGAATGTTTSSSTSTSTPANCSDGEQNGDETGIDCGGSCGPCSMPCEGDECDKVKQAVSEEQFLAIFEMLAPNGKCAEPHCLKKEEHAGNCDMYKEAGAQAFYQVAAEYPGFLSSDDPDTNKIEVAALFSNVIQESGLQEWATPWENWPPHTLSGGAIQLSVSASELSFSTARTGNPKIAKGLCFSFEMGAEPDSWFGRGPIQLTGESNYAQASYGMSEFNDLTCQAAVTQGLSVQEPPIGVGHNICDDKNLASSNAVVAWRTALWFWTNMRMSPVSNWGHKVWPAKTCSEVINSAQGDHTAVAGTIQVINGGLECIKGQEEANDGGTFGKNMRRINNYVFVLQQLGLNVDASKVWSDIMTRCYQGEDYTP